MLEFFVMIISRLPAFLLLSLIWVIFSGKMDLFHLFLGLFSVLLVTAWTGDLLFRDREKSKRFRMREFFGLLTYSGWLLYQIVLANFHVLYVAIHPNMKKIINPKMIRFKTSLKKEVPLFFLANSITLTPGTVTVKILKNEFLVHALTDKIAKSCPGDMETKITSIFREHS